MNVQAVWVATMSNKPRKRIGYGRPPTATRFKKGVSGNPKGRPKDNPNIEALFHRELKRKRSATIDGKSVKLPGLELIVVSLMQRALQGDHKACQLVLGFATSFRPSVTEPEYLDPMELRKLSSQELTRLCFEALKKR